LSMYITLYWCSLPKKTICEFAGYSSDELRDP